MFGGGGKISGFNSSVGILLVHARLSNCPRSNPRLFQFLSRNSSRSRTRRRRAICKINHGFNSSVGILLVHALWYWWLPLPFSGFQFLSRNSSRSREFQIHRRTRDTAGFNSSVGILLVHAYTVEAWDKENGTKVSIPQSEFFSFTLSHALRFTLVL